MSIHLTTKELKSLGKGFGFKLLARLGLWMAIGLPGIGLNQAQAASGGYSFTPVVFLGDPAPGPEGGTFVGDFEPSAINSRGQVAFIADISSGGEGVFLGRPGQVRQIMRVGEPAPGGGTFTFGVWGTFGLNNLGDVGFAAPLEPFTLPLGMNSGVYRYSHDTRTLSALVVPAVTPAPGGGTFQGAYFRSSINKSNDIVFGGIVPTANGIHVSGEDYLGVGLGVFLATASGQISSVVSPGDPAPGGGTFDFAQNPWINDVGDIAFGAHVAGEECITSGPQTNQIFCSESVYLKKAATGQILSIAHQGDPAPGGGTYRLAFGGILNNRGQMVFAGDLTSPPDTGKTLGVFLYNGTATVAVARPGDAMPGGGKITSTSFNIGNQFINNRGDVSFNCTLDTDVDSDGNPDTGAYVLSHGNLQLVARTGTLIPGVGTIAQIQNPFSVGGAVNGGAIINDRGQVFFEAILSDGNVVILVATP